MGTIAENLNTLYDIKDDIKAAIEGKGVDVGEAPFVEYAQKINDIQQNVDCEEAYNSGYNQGQTEGYKMGYRVGNAEGFTAGKTLGQDMQKAKLTTLTVTENGVYEAEDGYKSVDVAVPIPTFETSELMIGINANGHYRYEPSNDGYSLVNINVTVDTQSYYDEGFREGKIEGADEVKNNMTTLEVTENGVYANPNGYNNVTVNVGNTENQLVIAPRYDLEYCAFSNGVVRVDLKNRKDAENLFLDCTFDNATFVITNYEQVTSMSTMFRGSNITTIPYLNTSNVTNMYGMFWECESLITIPQLNTRNVTNMHLMFDNCKSLTSIPNLDTSSVTDMGNMFYYCKSLTSIPQLNTSNVTDMSKMFTDCTSLTTVPQLNTRNVTLMNWMFGRCKSLTSIPQLNTSNVTNMECMFYACTALTSIPQLDVSSVTNMAGIFTDCTSLTTVGGFVGLKTSMFISKSPLSLESVYNIANTVAEVTDGQSITFSDYTKGILTDEVIGIFTSKGWTIN